MDKKKLLDHGNMLADEFHKRECVCVTEIVALNHGFKGGFKAAVELLWPLVETVQNSECNMYCFTNKALSDLEKELNDE